MLRLASSVDVRARGVRGVQTDFALRGANFGQMLVLVDGVRLNDAQSGHHNGDIPVPLDAVERIEILHGAGSSLFGADAFGGTVNVITRRGASTPGLRGAGRKLRPRGRQRAGGLRARRAVSRRCAVSADRSSGFMYDRDFETVLARSRTALGRTAVSRRVPAEGVRREQLLRQRAVARVDQPDAGRRRPSLGRASGLERRGQRVVPHARRSVSLQPDDPGSSPTTAIARTRVHRRHDGHAPRLGGERLADAGRRGRRRLDPLDEPGRPRPRPRQRLRRVAAGLRRRARRSTPRCASIATTSSARPGVRRSASAGGRPSVAASARVGGPRVPRADVHRALLLGSGEPGRVRKWGRKRLVRRGRRGPVLPAAWVLQATVFGRADDDVIDWLRPTAAERWRTYNMRDVEHARRRGRRAQELCRRRVGACVVHRPRWSTRPR